MQLHVTTNVKVSHRSQPPMSFDLSLSYLCHVPVLNPQLNYASSYDNKSCHEVELVLGSRKHSAGANQTVRQCPKRRGRNSAQRYGRRCWFLPNHTL